MSEPELTEDALENQFPKRPNWTELEAEVLAFWTANQVYHFDQAAPGKMYSIDTPPPTISGVPHIGHAFSYSQTEFIARYQRMNGSNVFYPFGYDNNGLPTEKLTEKTFKVKASKMPREEFIRLTLQLTEEQQVEYKRIWQRLGISCDWNYCYSTISKRVQRLSQLSFLRLNQKGRIYQANSPTLWCPECQTAISQMELNDVEQNTIFYYLKFTLAESKEPLTIATTRPELLSSIVAVFVNPEDDRFKSLVGKDVIEPLFGKKVKIMADHRVLKDQGSGAVMCCTFGDQTDIEWYRAYNLPYVQSIGPNGKMTSVAGEFEGLPLLEARKAIVKKLSENKAIEKEQPLVHSIKTHERCNSPVEFLQTNQWFIKYLDLKEKFIELGREINWRPEHMRYRYENWVNGLQWDWCISRQRSYGIRFPVWHCKKCKQAVFAREEDLPVDPFVQQPAKPCACGSTEFDPEKDVLDTWATSCLTPLINAKWEEGDDAFFKKLYPMTLRANAHDIISFWDFNTIAICWLHTGQKPFSEIMVSGHGLDGSGNKMSKSKGNTVSPIEQADKYSGDAIRWWAASAGLGQDLWFREADVKRGLAVSTKLWNVKRLIKGVTPTNETGKMELSDQWINAALYQTTQKMKNYFDKDEYSVARQELERFFYDDFCDTYLELIKWRAGSKQTMETVTSVYEKILLLFAPFLPFVTEKLWLMEHEKSIHLEQWPKTTSQENEFAKQGEILKSSLSVLRKAKQDQKISFGQEMDELTLFVPKSELEMAATLKVEMANCMRIKNLKIQSDGNEYHA